MLQASRYRADEPGYQQWRAPQEMARTTRDALRWLTVNGAAAAGMGDEIGSLTPGKRADIVLLEMGGISQAGWNRRDPAGAIIAQAHAGCVDNVLVEGRVVKRWADSFMSTRMPPCARSTSRMSTCTPTWSATAVSSRSRPSISRSTGPAPDVCSLIVNDLVTKT